jgi:hypothetical protein
MVGILQPEIALVVEELPSGRMLLRHNCPLNRPNLIEIDQKGVGREKLLRMI